MNFGFLLLRINISSERENLAIADLLFTVFCVPFTASDYIFSKWPFGSLWCKVVQYLTYVTAYASVYTLLLLSLDRYCFVILYTPLQKI
ncbi:Cysteinyl leukotriene receptor 2 [Armadillidium vulgare]|nr:Cysteinyl leukotriene receptor 2 [Armadillidium vulgare]